MRDVIALRKRDGCAVRVDNTELEKSSHDSQLIQNTSRRFEQWGHLDHMICHVMLQWLLAVGLLYDGRLLWNVYILLSTV